MRYHVIIAVIAACSALGAARADAQRTSEEAVFNIGKPARVEAGRSVESAIVIGDDLVIAGDVDGVAAAIGGDVRVLAGARVDGAVVVVGGALEVDPSAQVDGPRMVTEGGDFRKVAGELSALDVEREAEPHHLGSIIRVAQMLAVFALSLFLVALAPRHVHNVRSTLLERAFAAGWIGFGTLLGTLPLCVLLVVSLIGIPLVPAVIVAFLAVCVLGLTAVAAAVGFALPWIKDPSNLLGAVTLGSAVLTLVAAIPVLGGLVLLVASSVGVGAVLLSRFGVRTADHYAPPTSELREPPPAQPAAITR